MTDSTVDRNRTHQSTLPTSPEPAVKSAAGSPSPSPQPAVKPVADLPSPTPATVEAISAISPPVQPIKDSTTQPVIDPPKPNPRTGSKVARELFDWLTVFCLWPSLISLIFLRGWWLAIPAAILVVLTPCFFYLAMWMGRSVKSTSSATNGGGKNLD